MMFLSQTHLLKGPQKQSRAAAETRAVNERAVVYVVLRVGQHDQVSHSLVDGNAKGLGKTPMGAGEENEGWRFIKCRQKRLGCRS